MTAPTVQEPSAGLVMLDRARLRRLADELQRAGSALGRTETAAGALLRDAAAAVDRSRSHAGGSAPGSSTRRRR